ncbi:KV5A1 protein, partial [Polypterus senegalus]|nr:KV5A1 protein [Polypterus senegalus]
MGFFILLALTAIAFSQNSMGQVVLTHRPLVKSVPIGDSVTLECQSSSTDVTSSLAWYLLRPGETHKLLFSSLGSRMSGTPSRFSDSKSGTVFSLTISGVQAEDAGHYYCQQHASSPLTQ